MYSLDNELNARSKYIPGIYFYYWGSDEFRHRAPTNAGCFGKGQ